MHTHRPCEAPAPTHRQSTAEADRGAWYSFHTKDALPISRCPFCPIARMPLGATGCWHWGSCISQSWVDTGHASMQCRSLLRGRIGSWWWKCWSWEFKSYDTCFSPDHACRRGTHLPESLPILTALPWGLAC